MVYVEQMIFILLIFMFRSLVVKYWLKRIAEVLFRLMARCHFENRFVAVLIYLCNFRMDRFVLIFVEWDIMSSVERIRWISEKIGI